MTKEIILDFLCYLFTLLFLYTGLNKLVENDVFRDALLKSPLLHSLTPILKIFIPLSEVSIGTFLLVPQLRRGGLYGFFALMSIFTVYIAFMLYFRSDRPCTCGGIIKYMNWHQHLYFNIAFTLLSILALRLDKVIKNMKLLKTDALSYPS